MSPGANTRLFGPTPPTYTTTTTTATTTTMASPRFFNFSFVLRMTLSPFLSRDGWPTNRIALVVSFGWRKDIVTYGRCCVTNFVYLLIATRIKIIWFLLLLCEIALVYNSPFFVYNWIDVASVPSITWQSIMLSISYPCFFFPLNPCSVLLLLVLIDLVLLPVTGQSQQVFTPAGIF